MIKYAFWTISTYEELLATARYVLCIILQSANISEWLAPLKSHYVHVLVATVTVPNDTKHVYVYDRNLITNVWWRITEVLVTIIPLIALASIQFNYLQSSGKMLHVWHGDLLNIGISLRRKTASIRVIQQDSNACPLIC